MPVSFLAAAFVLILGVLNLWQLFLPTYSDDELTELLRGWTRG